MKLETLWKNYKIPNCEKCKKDCSGALNYDSLCSNLNYLRNYAENNYEKKQRKLYFFQRLV